MAENDLPPEKPNGCLAGPGDPPCALPPGEVCAVCNARREASGG